MCKKGTFSEREKLDILKEASEKGANASLENHGICRIQVTAGHTLRTGKVVLEKR